MLYACISLSEKPAAAAAAAAAASLFLNVSRRAIMSNEILSYRRAFLSWQGTVINANAAVKYANSRVTRFGLEENTRAGERVNWELSRTMRGLSLSLARHVRFQSRSASMSVVNIETIVRVCAFSTEPLHRVRANFIRNRFDRVQRLGYIQRRLYYTVVSVIVWRNPIRDAPNTSRSIKRISFHYPNLSFPGGETSSWISEILVSSRCFVESWNISVNF